MRLNREFKQTEMGRIPKDWEVVRLGEMLIECYRYPTYYNIEYVTEGVPEIRGELLLENGQIQFDLKKFRYISENTAQKFHRVRVEEGDLVLSVRGTMGKIGYVPRELESAVVTANLMRLSPDRQKTYPKWLMHYLSSDKFQRSLNNLSPHTTIKTIQAPLLKSISISRPPLPEQKKIAEILSTVDQAIEKVDEAIEKTQRLKNGLMQRLLTKGIGHKEFKDTEIGKIPKEWEVVKIKELGNVFTGKTPSTSNSIYWNGTIPFITPADIKEAKYVYETERYVTPAGTKQIGYILPEDTVLVVCIGSTIGKTGVTYRSSVINQQINAIICNEKTNAHYAYYTITYKADFLKSFSGVAAVPIVKKSLFEEFKLPRPPLSEQKKTAEILSTVDKRLELLRERKEKLERIKKGLMNDLLTGKKRVRLEA